MRRRLWALALACGLLLTGCGQMGEGSADPGDGSAGKSNAAQGGVLSLRIVDGAETGELVLAGEEAGAVYTLSVGKTPVYLDGDLSDAAALEDGMMADIAYDGGIMESYPGRFGAVRSISVYSRGTEQNPGGSLYDLCGLYLQVLEDLWQADDGLNGGAESISVDLSQAPGDLTRGEQEAITWIFSGKHDVQGLSLTQDELAEQGYLTEVELSGDGDKDQPALYQWDNGVLFTITPDESAEGEIYSLPTVCFDAKKWRSPLGAYYFSGCKALWAEMGSWSSYTVESEAIS